jgi:hypothetical protein
LAALAEEYTAKGDYDKAIHFHFKASGTDAF